MNLGLVYTLSSLLLVSTFSAAHVFGHTWRFHPAITQLIDTKFIVSVAFVFGQELLIAFSIWKVFSASCQLLFSKPKALPVIEEVRQALKISLLGIGLLFSSYTFMKRYLGLTLEEASIGAGILLLLIGATIYSADRFIARVISDFSLLQDSKNDIKSWNTFKAIILSPAYATAATCGLIASLICGELHFSYLVDEVNSVIKFPDNNINGAPEVINVVGPTSKGMLYAYYRGPKYRNSKEIVFFYEVDSGDFTIQATRESGIGALIGMK